MSMIYMIRHGQASFGKEDYDQLSPLGKRQARILAQHFLDTGFQPDAVYSGTMARQTATAKEVLDLYRGANRKAPELKMLSSFNEYDTAAIIKAPFPDMVKDDPSLNEELPKMYASKDSFKRVFEAAMLRWVSGKFDGLEYGNLIYSIEPRSDNFPLVQAALVGDTTVSDSYGPLSGRRWRLRGTYAYDTDEGGALNQGGDLDFRQYVPVTRRSQLAFRAFGGYASGSFPSVYAVGGLDTIRGYDYRSLVGDRAFFANLEYLSR